MYIKQHCESCETHQGLFDVVGLNKCWMLRTDDLVVSVNPAVWNYFVTWILLPPHCIEPSNEAIGFLLRIQLTSDDKDHKTSLLRSKFDFSFCGGPGWIAEGACVSTGRPGGTGDVTIGYQIYGTTILFGCCFWSLNYCIDNLDAHLLLALALPIKKL